MNPGNPAPRPHYAIMLSSIGKSSDLPTKVHWSSRPSSSHQGKDMCIYMCTYSSTYIYIYKDINMSTQCHSLVMIPNPYEHKCLNKKILIKIIIKSGNSRQPAVFPLCSFCIYYSLPWKPFLWAISKTGSSSKRSILTS